MKVLKFTDIEITDVHSWDAPDYVDAWVCSATAILEDGSCREATTEELDTLTADGDFMQQAIHDYLN